MKTSIRISLLIFIILLVFSVDSTSKTIRINKRDGTSVNIELTSIRNISFISDQMQITSGNGSRIFFSVPTVQNMIFNLSTHETGLIEDKNIRIYPNPVTEYLNIESPDPFVHIKIFNLQGQLLLTKTSNNTFLTIPLSNLETGIYIVSIQTINNSFTFRIQKNK